MTFDEAVSRFEDKEVDLLHIDGYHIYEAVRHDFENWRPKMSDRGIILFHDVVERIADFGVWRLWEELTSRHASFTFLHEHGLGVLGVGPDLPDEVRALLELRGPEVEPVRTVFRELGRRLRLASELELGLTERDAARAERDGFRAERDGFRASGTPPGPSGTASAPSGTASAPSGTPPGPSGTASAPSGTASAPATASAPSGTASAPSGTPPGPSGTASAERDGFRAERDAARAERDGFRAELASACGERDTYRAGLEATRADRDRILSALRATGEQLAGLRRDWEERFASQSYRAFDGLMLRAGRIAPSGTRRRLALKRAARLVEVLAREGAAGLARRQIGQVIDRDAGRRGGVIALDVPAPDGSAAHRPDCPGGMPVETLHSKGISGSGRAGALGQEGPRGRHLPPGPLGRHAELPGHHDGGLRFDHQYPGPADR